MGTFHFFTNIDNLGNTQVKPFGPVSGLLETNFRIENGHSKANSGNLSLAYAITNGSVFLQQTSNPLLINIVLIPTQQLGIADLKINYFIYKGILKSSLINSGSIKPVSIPIPTKNLTLAEMYHDAQIKSDMEWDKNHQQPIGTTANIPSENLTGIQFNSSNSNPQLQKLDTDSINSIAYHEGTYYSKMIVNAGTILGEFGTEFGLMICLEDYRYKHTLGVARNLDSILQCPLNPISSANYDLLTYNHKREEILYYFDSCAFFNHIILESDNYLIVSNVATNSKIKYDFSNYADFYCDVLDKFNNKDLVYIDIRNESNFSLNYNLNYGNEIKIGYEFDPVVSNPAPLELETYNTHKWPLKIINGSFISSIFSNNTLSFQKVTLKLPEGDNPKGILYMPNNQFSGCQTETISRFERINITTGFTNSIVLQCFNHPNINQPRTRITAYYLKVRYFRCYFNESFTYTDTSVPYSNNYLNTGIPLFADIINIAESLKFNELDDHHTYFPNLHKVFLDCEEDLGISGIYELGLSINNDRVIYSLILKEVFNNTFNYEEIDYSKSTTMWKRDSRILDELDVSSIDIPNFNIYKRTLHFGSNNDEIYYLKYGNEYYPYQEFFDEYCFLIAISRSEFNTLKNAAISYGYSSNLHPCFLSFSSVTHDTDNLDSAFSFTSVNLQGFNINGNMEEIALNPPIYVRTEDGKTWSSDSFCRNYEGKRLISQSVFDDLPFFKNDTIGTSYYKISDTLNNHILRISKTNSQNRWAVLNNLGSPVADTFVNSFSKIVLLGKKNLNVNSIRKTYYKVVFWNNTNYYMGYISENAFYNAQTPMRFHSKVMPSIAEVADSFANDIKRILKQCISYTGFNSDLKKEVFNQYINNINNSVDKLLTYSIKDKYEQLLNGINNSNIEIRENYIRKIANLPSFQQYEFKGRNIQLLMADYLLVNGKFQYEDKISAVATINQSEPIKSLGEIFLHFKIIDTKAFQGSFNLVYNNDINKSLEITLINLNDQIELELLYQSPPYSSTNNLLLLEVNSVINKFPNNAYKEYVLNKLDDIFGLPPSNFLGTDYYNINDKVNFKVGDMSHSQAINAVLNALLDENNINDIYNDFVFSLIYVNPGLKNTLFSITNTSYPDNPIIPGSIFFLMNKVLTFPLSKVSLNEMGVLNKYSQNLPKLDLDTFNEVFNDQALTITGFKNFNTQFFLKVFFESASSIRNYVNNNNITTPEANWLNTFNYHEVMTVHIPGNRMWGEELRIGFDDLANESNPNIPKYFKDLQPNFSYMDSLFAGMVGNDLSFGLICNNILLGNYFHENTQNSGQICDVFLDTHSTSLPVSEFSLRVDRKDFSKFMINYYGIKEEITTGHFLNFYEVSTGKAWKRFVNAKVVFQSGDFEQVIHQLIWDNFRNSENFETVMDDFINHLINEDETSFRIFEFLFKEKLPLTSLMLGHYIENLEL